MTLDDDLENLVWLQEERSLSELCQRFPEAWQDIKQNISRRTRINPINRFLVQKLFFSGNTRKPVSFFLFNLIWPLIWQKERVLDSIELQGIYCFYSKELIKALSALIGSKTCLEVAAGDGTLARFLSEQGSDIIAIDDQSWDFAIEYPDFVIQNTVEEALFKYKPEIVLCSWPPRDNDFEKAIFACQYVKTYVVLSSRIMSASGNWSDYKDQKGFSFQEDLKLSKFILPPELKPAVYIFNRYSHFNNY